MSLYKLDEYERNGYDDSDGYAVCWNSETGTIEQHLTWTTRGHMTNGPKLEQPTEEVLALAELEMARRIFNGLKHEEQARRERPGRDELVRGARVRIMRAVRSRKAGMIEAGSEGTVFWFGADQYDGPHYRNSYKVQQYRAGVQLDDGRKYFFATRDLQLVLDMPSDEELQARARKQAATRYWLGTVRTPRGYARMI